jgi:hypothetical protein
MEGAEREIERERGRVGEKEGGMDGCMHACMEGGREGGCVFERERVSKVSALAHFLSKVTRERVLILCVYIHTNTRIHTYIHI